MMKPLLPSWWKWLAVLLLGVVLVSRFVWRGDQYIHADIVENQIVTNSPHPVFSRTSVAGRTKTSTADNSSDEHASQPLNEMEQRFSERTAFEQRLQKESTGELLSRLETLWRQTESSSRPSEEKALSKIALTLALHSGDENFNASAFQKLSALLRDNALPITAKMEIAAILGSVQTPQSVQLLLTEYQQSNDNELRESLAKQIERTGDNLWGGPFHDDLSAPLETAWPRAKDDPTLANSAAVGLAKVGAASGVQLLVDDVLRTGQTVQGLNDIKDAQGEAAFLALVKIRNPNAIPILSAGLLNANSSEVNQYVCGLSLASMGRGEATQVLLQWAVTATDEDVAWAEQWFGKLRDTASFDMIAAALNQTTGVAFNSAKIRNAVALGQKNRKQ